MNLQKVITGGVLLAGVAILGTAQAADPKNYAGATCQRVSGSTIYDSAARIFNTSNAAVASVVCPILRDDVLGGGSSWASANMTVIDNNNAQGFSCTAMSRSANGASGFFSSASTAPAFVGTATIAFAPITKVAGGYYAVRCTIPQRNAAGAVSTIASYRVVENNPAEP